MNILAGIFLIIIIIFLLRFCKGDINHDGKVTVHDIIIVQRYLEGYNDKLSLFDLYCMDVNRDYRITEEDINQIQKYIVGLKKRGEK